MKSPWKVIAGLVSRRDPEISAEAADEMSVAPDPRAEKPDVEVVALPQIVALPSQSSTHRTEDFPAGVVNAPTDGLGRPNERETSIAAVSEVRSGPSLADDAEPVLATTIRLVTSDRLSVRESLPASTAMANGLEADAHDDPVGAKISLDEKATELTAHLNNAAETANDAESKTPSAKVKRTEGRRPKRSTRIVERPTRISRTARPTKVEPSEASLVGDISAEVMDLDCQITQLRYQLAQKLRRQNEQLKQLLARYDRS
jgi:hypothetical protein